MLNFSKSTIAVFTLALTFTLSSDLAEAGKRGGKGGSSRGRSMSKSFSKRSSSIGNRSSNRSSSFGKRSSNRSSFNRGSQQSVKKFNSSKIGNRMNKNIGNRNNSKIGSQIKNNKIGNRFDNKTKDFKRFDKKGDFKKNFTKHGKHFDRKGHKFHGHKHGHHGHKHHKRRWFGWGGWYRPVWGFNTYRPAPVYCNPYCSTITVDNSFGYPGQSQSFDYSQPITDQNNDMTEKGAQLMQEARQAFLAGNYEAASKIIAQAAQEMPKNHDVHQFRSLILFAMQDYSNAAGAAHVALTGGPGWNWTTLRSFYNEKETYTQQLRKLEEARTANTKAPELRFLLGYHYLMMNHVESAARELAIAVELEPRDELSKKLVDAITSKTGKTYESETEEEYEVPAPPEVLEDTEELPAPVEAAPEQEETSLNGVFNASPAEGVNFKLELKADGKFVWAITAPQNNNEFSGTFEIEENVITLTRDEDGEEMVAVITPMESGFNFKMQNGDSNDPGLNFVPVVQ